jgi:hypothetical protein
MIAAALAWREELGFVRVPPAVTPTVEPISV